MCVNVIFFYQKGDDYVSTCEKFEYIVDDVTACLSLYLNFKNMKNGIYVLLVFLLFHNVKI